MKSNNNKNKQKNTNPSQRINNNGDKPTKVAKSRNKSVEIIRENQPLKFRQTINQQQQQEENEEQQVQSEGDSDWEDGSINPPLSTTHNHLVQDHEINDNVNKIHGVTVEFDALPEVSSKKKRIRRATAEDKLRLETTVKKQGKER